MNKEIELKWKYFRDKSIGEKIVGIAYGNTKFICNYSDIPKNTLEMMCIVLNHNLIKTKND